MAGFEDLPRNGLEQLFINIANERLQYFFNDHLLSQEQKSYKDEGVHFNKSNYKNNDALMSLFVVSFILLLKFQLNFFMI